MVHITNGSEKKSRLNVILGMMSCLGTSTARVRQTRPGPEPGWNAPVSSEAFMQNTCFQGLGYSCIILVFNV